MVLPTDQWTTSGIAANTSEVELVLPTDQLANQWHRLQIHQKFSYGHLLLFYSLPVLLSFGFYGLSGLLVGQPASQVGQQVGQPVLLFFEFYDLSALVCQSASQLWGHPAATDT